MASSGTIGKVVAGGNTYLVASTAYGTCTTAAATVAKVATVQDSAAFTLMNGVTVHIWMQYSNTASSPTLNVNSTGAKPIYRYGTTVPSTSAATSWQAGSVVAFTYNTNNASTGAWVMNGWLNDDSNTNNAVTQTDTESTNADYRVLFSATADDTTRTEGARKDGDFTYNPSTGNLKITQINGVTVGSSPKFTDNNTTYSAGTGLSLSSTTFNHSNSVTAGTAGTSTATSGNSLAVPYVTYDAQGHITASGTHTHTITNNITGSGTSGYIAKFNGANTITNGPAFGSSTSTFLRNDGSWATPTAAQTYTTCNLPKFTAAGSQAVTVSGITASSNPILDIYIDTAAHAAAFNEIWSHIYRADTAANKITFYCDAAISDLWPSDVTNVTVMIKGY